MTDIDTGKKAPRVTIADVNNSIASEHYFTAEQGAFGAAAFIEDGDTHIEDVNFSAPKPLAMLTICVMVLKNGFTVIGESSCVSFENFDSEIGRAVARKNAHEKIWPLLGYALKDKLAQQI